MPFIYLFISLLYIALILFISSKLIDKPMEFSRTFAHIMIINWWLIAAYLIKDFWLALSAPLFFIFFNALNVHFDWIPSINTKRRTGRYGTVYYALSVALMVIAWFGSHQYQIAGAIGLFTMAYGDGLAALVGQRYGKHGYVLFKNKKSFEGSLTMFAVSLITCIAFQYFSAVPVNLITALLVAVVATVVEAISPHGIDNLFIPILVSLLYFILLL